MEQPEGFKLPRKENKVWQLHKTLYGLKQAGLSWWCTMTKSMLALGFKRCKSDAGVYYYHDKKTKALVIAIVYVNDIVTNFIWPYLHQFFIDSHGLNGHGKPLKRPFDQYQSRLKAINNGRDIRQINW